MFILFGQINIMKKYKIPVYWESIKEIEVEAENLQSAVYQALKQFLSEPDENYINDSFMIDNIIEDIYPEETFNIHEIYESL